MKIHEEEWVAAAAGDTSGPPRYILTKGDLRSLPILVASIHEPHDGRARADAVARLIAAAPEMARALLALGYGHEAGGTWHTEGCLERHYRGLGTSDCLDSCSASREALRNAGVLP